MSATAFFGFWIKKVVAGLVLLPNGPLIAIALGAWIGRRRRRLGPVLIVVGVVTLTVCGLPIVANSLAAYDEREFPPLAAGVPLPPNAAIVVLGGGLQLGATDYGGETINAVTLVRLRSAARLAARTKLPILVTGGRPPEAERSEADYMASTLQQDLATPVRWLEKQSLDTAENARLSVPILEAGGIRTAILVTDVQHMRRARALFEAAGMPVIPAPTDYYGNSPWTVLAFIPNTGALRRTAWTLHEWIGLFWTRLAR